MPFEFSAFGANRTYFSLRAPMDAHNFTATVRSLLAWVLVVAAFVASCASSTPDLQGWRHGTTPVSTDVIQTLAGAEHCDEQSSTFLVMGWPLGFAEPSISNARWYVRNPTAFIRQNYLTTDFYAGVTPPADASFTDYHDESFELWLAPSDEDATVYVKTRGRFERWPRSTQPLLCV